MFGYILPSDLRASICTWGLFHLWTSFDSTSNTSQFFCLIKKTWPQYTYIFYEWQLDFLLKQIDSYLSYSLFHLCMSLCLFFKNFCMKFSFEGIYNHMNQKWTTTTKWKEKEKKNPFILKNKNIIYIFAQSCCNLMT